jgi:hypothetical protein
VSLVSASDFGRKPISDGMAPRYAAALDILGDIVRRGDTVPPDAAARLSELKGMANRCLRRDQADWLSVWRLLGSPDADRLRVLRDLARSARDGLASGDPTLAAGILADLTRSGWADALSEARRTLRRRPGAASESGAAPEPASSPEPGPGPQEETELKDTDPMNDEVIPTRRTVPSEALQQELAIASEADRNCNTHEAVRYELKAALLRAGMRPSDSPVVDVSRVGEDGLFLYEILGAGRSSYADLRAGAARLLEVNHTLPRTADRLYLVLSEPPAQDWAADTVREVFGVHLLWRTAHGWGGEDKETALCSSNHPAAHVP